MKDLTVLLEKAASYRKRPGTLKVFEEDISWNPLSSESQSSVCLSLSDVKSQMVSAQGSKQALLKLTTVKNSDSYVFEFVQAAKPDFISRDEVKEVISRQLAKVKVAVKQESTFTKPPVKESQDKVSVTPEEAKRRLEILRKRPELQKLHMSLVGGGLISDAQFWLGIRYRLDRSEQKLLDNEGETSVKQVRGISSEILSEISPVEEKGKTVKYRLTQDIIHKIFLEQPAVYLAYQSYVPNTMSEQAFWTQYFQSRYICQGNKSTSEKDDIFAPFEAQVQEGKHMKNKEEALKNIESEINLLLEDKSSQSGYGLNEHSMTNQIREDPSLPLLQRLNRHSSLIVEASNIGNESLTKEELDCSLTGQQETPKEQQLPTLRQSFPHSRQPKSTPKTHNWNYLVTHLKKVSLKNLNNVKPPVDISRRVLEELFNFPSFV